METIREYLTQKGVEYRDNGKELMMHCPFGDCDKDSHGTEAHFYVEAETSLYICHKCGAKGNSITLMRHFGDDARNILTNNPEKPMNTPPPDVKKIWESASVPSIDFPYFAKKKILPHHSRFLNDRLVLPLYSPNDTLSSLQFIDADGDKKFLTGSAVAGCYSGIGTPTTVLCIAEGFATAASIFEATGYATAIAFSAGNLKAVAKTMKLKYPELEIIICGDTDPVGSQKAKEAAEAIGAKLALPSFEIGEQINGEKPSDFNDLSFLRGHISAQSCIASAILIPSRFSFTPLSALLNEPEEEISWVVEDILPSGGFSVIIAKPKVGKSTLARQIALSVARGEPFFGKQTSKGLVLYISLEEKRSEVKNHFQLMDADGTEELGVYVGAVPEKANEWLKKAVESKNPILVIIDTLFRFIQVADINDYSKVLAALDPLLTLARASSAHLMCVHHARKSIGDGADTALGSTAIFGSVDTAIMLNRNSDGKRTIETRQRYGTDMEITILAFDPDTKMAVLGETKEEDDIKKTEEAIISFLKSIENPIKEKDIEQEIVGRTPLKRRALRNLVQEGKITRIGAGKRNDPYLYSCSLVPAIYVEQEKQESGIEIKVDNNPIAPVNILI